MCDQFDKIVVSADFNMPHISWSNESDIPIITDSFIEILNDHFLTQVNTSPTRVNNILDFIITTVPEYVMITDVETTDHSVIITNLVRLFGRKKERAQDFFTISIKQTFKIFVRV